MSSMHHSAALVLKTCPIIIIVEIFPQKLDIYLKWESFDIKDAIYKCHNTFIQK